MLSRRTFLGTGFGAATAPSAKPNIILILADDLGYSDIGCFGGEIRTPSLDRLARGGVRFTHFYNTARCCPSRASLLTGLYPHQAGMGAMAAPRPNTTLEGYQGRLNDRCATMAEVLREAGYATVMSGKWHLNAETGPVHRGFDEYYGLVHGFDSFWDASKYRRLPDGTPARDYRPGTFYATDAITDHALDFLDMVRERKKPYFLYLAYNAPHFPLHAPKPVIDRYAPVYSRGWDSIRESRFERMRKLGIAGPAWKLTPRSIIPPNRFADETGWSGKQNPSWSSLDAARRADLARRMAVFAAMVEIMDQNIGRLVSNLERNGELDNTLVIFLSDNGACAEWDPFGFDVRSGPQNILHQGPELEKMGQPGTYHSYGSGWANAGNTPFRLYKHYNHEGGICTPFLAHWPAGIARRGAIERQPAHLIDLMPTLVEVAGARYPAGVQPMEGSSMVPAFAGRPMERDALYWEHEGNRAMRAGRWKIAAVGPAGAWELYDLERDPMEMHDLAAADPVRLRLMAGQWEAWAKRTNTVPWPWKA